MNHNWIKIKTKVKILGWKVTSDSPISVLCLTKCWPRRQRHLLLKRRTNVYATISRVFVYINELLELGSLQPSALFSPILQWLISLVDRALDLKLKDCKFESCLKPTIWIIFVFYFNSTCVLGPFRKERNLGHGFSYFNYLFSSRI